MVSLLTFDLWEHDLHLNTDKPLHRRYEIFTWQNTCTQCVLLSPDRCCLFLLFSTCQISYVKRTTFNVIVNVRALVDITITAYPITHLADVLTCVSTMGGVNIALPWHFIFSNIMLQTLLLQNVALREMRWCQEVMKNRLQNLV